MTAYIVLGSTVRLAATTSSTGTAISPAAANSGVGGATGPTFFKVVNTSTTVPVFFATGATAPTAVSAQVGSNCIAPGATDFIQVGVPGQAPATVYFAVIAASSVDVYVTPVALV